APGAGGVEPGASPRFRPLDDPAAASPPSASAFPGRAVGGGSAVRSGGWVSAGGAAAALRPLFRSLGPVAQSGRCFAGGGLFRAGLARCPPPVAPPLPGGGRSGDGGGGAPGD